MSRISVGQTWKLQHRASSRVPPAHTMKRPRGDPTPGGLGSSPALGHLSALPPSFLPTPREQNRFSRHKGHVT